MSIASEISRLQTAKSDLKTSIENKGVTVPSATTLDGYAALVDQISGGGSPNIQALSVTANGTYTATGGVDGYSPVTVNVPSSGVTTTEEPNSTGTTLYINSGNNGGVRFIDYDGTILHSYSASEFANLTAMPANPSHTGLTSQGWNWSLANAKAQMVAQPNDTLTIGQMYVTNDGKTRVYISLVDSARLSPYLGICPNGTVVVDWGDNSATDTLTGTSLTYTQRAHHTYASTGDYVITLTVSSGAFALYGAGSSSNGSNLLTRISSTSPSQRCYQNTIQKVELGSNVSLGMFAFQYCYSLASITIPSGVTSIGTNAFNFCCSLTSLTIPSGVTSIEANTFNYCNSLTSLTIPSGVTSIGSSAFQSCYSLTSLTIPSGVTSIGSSAFNYCRSLTSLTIPSGVTSIGDSAFQYCSSLTSLTIPSGVTSISNSMFGYCHSLTSLTIPSDVTSIGNSAFQSCYSLTDLTIPSGVTSIGSSAFSSCSSLTSLTIPSGVTSISNSTFGYCSSLTSLTIPSDVTSIGYGAFQSCYSLTDLTIPSGVTSIGSSAFQYCCSLTSLTIPSGVTSISNSTFGYCYSLTSLVLPSGLTSIGNNVFQSCYSLTDLTIPSGVTSIGSSAFFECYSLASLTIPSGLTSIAANTFQYCYSLASITIPSGVTSIGANAFPNCWGVAEYHFLSTTPPTLRSTNAFTGILTDCKIYVPAASLTAYQEATNWSTYASYMVGE